MTASVGQLFSFSFCSHSASPWPSASASPHPYPYPYLYPYSYLPSPSPSPAPSPSPSPSRISSPFSSPPPLDLVREEGGARRTVKSSSFLFFFVFWSLCQHFMPLLTLSSSNATTLADLIKAVQIYTQRSFRSSCTEGGASLTRSRLIRKMPLFSSCLKSDSTERHSLLVRLGGLYNIIFCIIQYGDGIGTQIQIRLFTVWRLYNTLGEIQIICLVAVGYRETALNTVQEPRVTACLASPRLPLQVTTGCYFCYVASIDILASLTF